MRITLSDIARETDLAPITVSQILRGTGTVRPETRERVLETARQLGYQPNRAAQAIRNGRFNTVGLLSRHDAHGFDLPGPVINGIADALDAHRIKVILIRAPDDALLQANSLPGLSNTFMVDGVIVSCWGEIPPALRHLAETAAYPACWVNADAALNAVRPDDRGAARRATEHLLRLGHRAIAYVDYSGSGHFSGRDRRNGYADAMREAGLAPHIVQQGVPPENRLAEAAHLFAGNARSSAFVTYCSYEAQPIILAAACRGLQVPRDLSIITFEGRVVNSIGLAVSTVSFPETEIGTESARILLARIGGHGGPMPSVTVPFGDIVGKTCAPPASAKRTPRRTKT